MSDWSVGARVAFVLGSVLAAIVGWFTVSRVAATDHGGWAKGAVNIYSCPMQGAVSIGQLHAGDAVWVMGVSEHRWAVIRHPTQPDRPAWVPLAMIRIAADPGALPEMGCDANPSAGTTTSTTTPPTTLPGATTTSTTTTSTTSTSTSTTVVGDVTPPTVTITTKQKVVYNDLPTAPACVQAGDTDSLTVSVVVADPTVPLSLKSVVAALADGRTFVPTYIKGTQWFFNFHGVAIAGPEVTLTITAIGEDGAGNLGTGTFTIPLRDPHQNGCA